YAMGAVDYVPVPVIPDVLRAKVKVFAELYRKTRQLEQLNRELERRVADRTAELEASTTRLIESERRRTLALAAGQMGSWDWDTVRGECAWDEGQCRIFGVDPRSFAVTAENVRALVHPEDLQRLEQALRRISADAQSYQTEFRLRRPNGELRWCIGTAAATLDAAKRVVRVSGVTVDITERKLVEEELAPYRTSEAESVSAIGPQVVLQPATAQALALALHELATNAAKYGALSTATGKVRLGWELTADSLVLRWDETGGPTVEP